MRLSHRPLIFRALLTLEEAAGASGKQPVPVSPGVRLALTYLFAIGRADRRVFDDFVEAIGREAQSWEADWVPGYLRQRDANRSIMSIVRSIGFEPTVKAIQAVRDGLKGPSSADAERRFWREVDLQAEHKMRRPWSGCEWLTPRPWPPVDHAGVSSGVSPAEAPPENG